MNILHTADWHLGHRLHEQSRSEEQEKFLQWLLTVISEKSIDVLLVAGDIFDTGYPSSHSLQMFYDFLAKLYKQGTCKQVVMTAGNHDAPGTINAPSFLVKSFSINLVGKAGENVKDEILNFEINEEKLTVAAVPFLRDRDIRKAVAGEDAVIIETRYKTALTNHYNSVASEIIKDGNTFVIAMGHLFAVGGQVSESENRIYVGGLGDMAASDFSPVFDYVALGHLHRPQKVNQKEHIRYSGSPYPLSFGEIGQKKKVILIETSGGKLRDITDIDIPVFRKLYSIKGTMNECKALLNEIGKLQDKPKPWVEVLINEPGLNSMAYMQINEAIKNLPLKVLKVRLLNYASRKGLEQLVKEDTQLDELQPEDVFRKKCEEENFDLNEHPDIMDAFNEILNEITEN